MKAGELGWYWRRLGQMSTREVGWRAEDSLRRRVWRRRWVRPGEVISGPVARGVPLGGAPPGRWSVVGGALVGGGRALVEYAPDEPDRGLRRAPVPLPPGLASSVPGVVADSLVTAAEGILAGRWAVLGVARADIARPDWFFDPVTRRRAPSDRYAFDVDTRSEAEAGNVKQVWEVSRHHHLTVLAAAWWLTGDDRYAMAVAEQLRSWWLANPFLSGVHWTSGIELGLRLVAWTWVRRLLDGWPGVEALFEDNPVCVSQVQWHQRYLAAFTSRGTSANNHVIAEAAGQLSAACAFPWFETSDRWRRGASSLLAQELARNTFPSGVNRELASEYHCLVAELGIVAAAEAAASGLPLDPSVGACLCDMVDAAAALVDERLAGPRQGDGDDGHVLLVDGPGTSERWSSLLRLGAALWGPLPWWPEVGGADVRSVLVGGLLRGCGPDGNLTVKGVGGAGGALGGAGAVGGAGGRPPERPWHFADAGITVLRAPSDVSAPDGSALDGSAPGPEIWCRADAGPHGYLSIAAHGHADALSVEVRHGGVEVFADPGTYCYHGDAEWRAYFRSTLGHNTVELAGRDQSRSGGPFLWVESAVTRELGVTPTSWSAEHDGYRSLDPPAVHRRRMTLDAEARRLTITDQVICNGRHPVRLAYHLGPRVTVEGRAGTALRLAWPGGAAAVRVPEALSWRTHRGDEDPILGWYAPSFGAKQPSTTLVGSGQLGSADGELVTIVDFVP